MAAGITEREYKGIIISMENLNKTVKDGFENVNKSIAAIHKEYNTRVTKLETKADSDTKAKVLLALLFSAIGWIVNHLFS